MKTRIENILIVLSLVIGCLCLDAVGEPDGRVDVGQMMPDYRLTTMDGRHISNDQHDKRVTVLVYVIANQRGSERAIADASMVVEEIGDPTQVELIFVTGNTDQAAYFEEFWESKSIHGTLALDPDRVLYAELGLIAFPSTFVVDQEGRVMHMLSTHSPNYPHVIEGYIGHAMGRLDDAGLDEHLKARSLPTSSPKSIASRHRVVARLMREKGLGEAAEKELLSAIEYDPESVDIRLDLADLYLELAELVKAQEQLDWVKAAAPDHRQALLLEGILLFRQGNYDSAQRVLTKALVLNPDPARTHYYLGRIFESVGNCDEAMAHYREAIGRYLKEPTD